MTQPNHIFILSGGAGTRLWPLSRESFPKQFYDLTGSGCPLIIETVDRLQGLGKITVITTDALKHSTIGLLNRYKIKDVEVLGEPVAKNTAAAVALASIYAAQQNPEATVAVFPADHYISEKWRFRELVSKAFDEARSYNDVVAIGIEPTSAETGYGYLQLSEQPTPAKVSVGVTQFIEKPELSRAEELVKSQSAVWNAGMFIFPAIKMLRYFEELMPDLWSKMSVLKNDFSKLGDVYPRVPSQSVDYGIMERLKSIRCVAGSQIGWSDVGSWEEVAKHGRNLTEPLEVMGAGNFYTGFGPHPKKPTFVGVSDLIVVDTPDVLLVLKKGMGQEVRELVKKVKADAQISGRLKHHVFEERPWGRFEVLMDNNNFKSKIITVWPGQKLSYQSHTKRSEHWIVVSGEGKVTLNDQVKYLKQGEYVYIPQGAKHRIANDGAQLVEFIEVQSGSYFGEDDITRYSDDYGRV